MKFVHGENNLSVVNLDGSVGSNEMGTHLRAENRPSEVHFVAYLLRKVYSSSVRRNLEVKTLVDRVTMNNLTLSQQASRLARAITLYQLEVNKAGRGRPLLPDGRIDPFRGGIFSKSEISHTGYTITRLQMDYLSIKDTFNDLDMRSSLHAETDLPPDVRGELVPY